MAEEEKEVTKEFTNAILALDPETGNILHFCGYFNKPKYVDYVKLYKELKSDSEFELTDKEFILVPCDDKDLPALLSYLAGKDTTEMRVDDGSEAETKH